MKKLILSLFGLMLTLASGATNVLEVDSITFYGNQLAQLTQYVEIGIRNTSATDFKNRLYLMAYNKDNGTVTSCLDTLVAIDASRYQPLTLFCILPEGNLELRMTTKADDWQVIGGTDVTISPLRKLDLTATFSLDMLTETDDERVLYGSRMRGWVRVQNEDTPYYGAYGGKGDDDGIVLWLEDSDSGERLFTKHIANRIGYWNNVECDFSHDAVFSDGAHYKLKVGYGMPYGLEPIDSLCFTTRNGTNTYWTAKGQVLPLPMGDDHRLMVPEEAVAVDLRLASSSHSPQFSIDASQANPNCLYYLDLPGDVPEGLDESRNLVRGLKATNIKLVEGHDYYCPLAFHAQFISYIMTPTYNNPDDEARGRGYSETIVLPFYTNNISLYDINGNTEMLHADKLTVLRYYGCYADSLEVSVVNPPSHLLAYEPYILGVYIGSSLLFTGEDTVVPMTGEAIVRGTGADFVGTTVAKSLSRNYYVYSPSSYSFNQGDADDVMAPFHACLFVGDALDMDYTQLNISDCNWGSSGKPGDAAAIDDLPVSGSRVDCQTVCDLQGRQIRNQNLGKHPLPKGVYIVGGRKVIVK